MWQCRACGYVWDGEKAPDRCPKCGAKKERFEQLEARAMDVVERSRYTNSLHMQLYVILEQVWDVAEDGIDDNLDSGCVEIFQQAVEVAEILQQAIKAELQSHMQKGKWG